MSRLCLIIIDGFGVAEPGPGNARHLAKTPFLDSLEKEVPNCLMDAAGNAVGLPEGQQGASEPGHLSMGAGRTVWMPLEEINRAVRSGEFANNPVLREACERAKERGTTLHLIGLYSEGGVHSHLDHYHAMLKLAKDVGVQKVMLHLSGDGRDMPERNFATEFDLLNKEIDTQKLGTVASLIGRFYSMDRDRKWDRTQVAYDLYVHGEGEEAHDLCEAIDDWYDTADDAVNTDQYVTPLKTPAFQAIDPNDTVVCINFRIDRMIQIVSALEAEDFKEFPRPVRIKDVVCMGPYSDHLPVAFPATDVPNTLGQIVSDAGLKQIRMTETDKFSHVTFFFNAQRIDPYPGEDRIMVKSPDVPNFCHAPEMSSAELTEKVIENAEKGEYSLMVVNYPNPDLCGHGGEIDGVIKACETVDKSLSVLLPKLEELGYDWIVTSDHGNAEEMYYPGTDTLCVSHTANQIQTFVKSEKFPTQESVSSFTGLKDIAPMCLNILELEVPKEMQ